MTPDDSLLVNYTYLAAFNTVTRYRILTPKGAIVIGEFPHSNGIASPPSKRPFIYSMPEGYLLSLIVEDSFSNPRRGQLHVTAALMHGEGGLDLQTQMLLSNYITKLCPVSYPLTPLVDPLDGKGHRRQINGTQPGLGNEIVESCPIFTRWRVLGVVFTMVTSAVGGTRYPSLVLDDGVRTHMRCTTSAGQGPSTTRTYFCGPGVSVASASTINLHIPLPVEVLMESTDFFRTETVNMDGSDQFSRPVYLVEELCCP